MAISGYCFNAYNMIPRKKKTQKNNQYSYSESSSMTGVGYISHANCRGAFGRPVQKGEKKHG